MTWEVRRSRSQTPECPLDGASRLVHLLGLDIRRQRPLAPVVGNLPRLVAEHVEEVADLVGLGGHALQVGNRARRVLTGVEQAHDRASFFAALSKLVYRPVS